MRRFFVYSFELENVYDLSGDRAAIEVRLAGASEFNLTGSKCKQGVIATDADVLACHNSSAALSNDDLADTDFLTIATLNAEILRI